jgi:hypothetical protein
MAALTGPAWLACHPASVQNYPVLLVGGNYLLVAVPVVHICSHAAMSKHACQECSHGEARSQQAHASSCEIQARLPHAPRGSAAAVAHPCSAAPPGRPSCVRHRGARCRDPSSPTPGTEPPPPSLFRGLPQNLQAYQRLQFIQELCPEWSTVGLALRFTRGARTDSRSRWPPWKARRLVLGITISCCP